MTIKKRIVIWYTIWMALLVVIASAVLLSGSGALIRREAIAEMEETVHDAAEDIRIRAGHLVFDDDIDFFDDGVYISIWQDGAVVDGRVPDTLGTSPPSSGGVSSVDGEEGPWYCFDLLLGEGYALRGAVRAYDMGAVASSLQLLVLLLLPLLVVLAALGGYFIVRKAFQSADRVIESAGEIAISDDMSKRIALSGGEDEIHRMAASFDLVLDRIEEAFEKERQFTSDASHELRTPISVILAEAEYAERHVSEDEKIRESLGVITRQAGKMSRLVAELLMIARSDKGTLKMAPERFDLCELVSVVLSTLEEEAGERGIALSVKGPEHMWVEADQDMITRVMINLVSNAIAYGRSGGWVIVSLSLSEGDAVISVEDNGIGIGCEHLGRIWDRFYQVDPSRSSGRSGAGLGLSIVEGIAKAHGGSVSAESEEGQGSIFTFRFPAERPG